MYTMANKKYLIFNLDKEEQELSDSVDRSEWKYARINIRNKNQECSKKS